MTAPEKGTRDGIDLCVHSRHDHRVKEFLDVLAFAEQEKVGFEFRLAPDIITHLYYNSRVLDRMAALSRDACPVQAHSHFAPGIGMEARRDLLSKMLEMSADMGLRAVTMHPSPFVEHLEIYSQYISPMIREFCDRHVIFAIENVPQYNSDTMNKLFYQIRKRLDTLKRKFVGMCFDIGHANCSYTNPTNYVKNLSFEIQIVNAHVHDNMGTKDEHLKIGQGQIDFVSVFKALFQRYSGPLVLEYWDDDEESMRSALKQLGERCLEAGVPLRRTPSSQTHH